MDDGAEPAIPPLVDSYRIGKLLGRGGMGSVYEARHIRLPRRFAVKFLRRGVPGEALTRFRREAEIASSLGSRHIVEVLDFNVTPEGLPYLVMELLTGESLAARLQRLGPLAPAPTLDLLRQVTAALEAAHERGIVHRDLKPANIFLSPAESGERAGDFVKLLDFGISKIAGAETLTDGSNLVGTPAYMSPEQAEAGHAADARSDVYSLGAVLYECITGHRVFEGANLYILLLRIRHEPPAPMAYYLPGFPPALEQVVQRALAKEPARRQSTVGELWRDFRAAFQASGGWQAPTTLGRDRLAASPRASEVPGAAPLSCGVAPSPAPGGTLPAGQTLERGRTPAPTPSVRQARHGGWLAAGFLTAIALAGLVELHARMRRTAEAAPPPPAALIRGLATPAPRPPMVPETGPPAPVTPPAETAAEPPVAAPAPGADAQRAPVRRAPPARLRRPALRRRKSARRGASEIWLPPPLGLIDSQEL